MATASWWPFSDQVEVLSEKGVSVMGSSMGLLMGSLVGSLTG